MAHEIAAQTAKLGSLVEVQDSEDPEGLRVFYYLVQDLKVRGLRTWLTHAAADARPCSASSSASSACTSRSSRSEGRRAAGINETRLGSMHVSVTRSRGVQD